MTPTQGNASDSPFTDVPADLLAEARDEAIDVGLDISETVLSVATEVLLPLDVQTERVGGEYWREIAMGKELLVSGGYHYFCASEHLYMSDSFVFVVQLDLIHRALDAVTYFEYQSQHYDADSKLTAGRPPDASNIYTSSIPTGHPLASSLPSSDTSKQGPNVPTIIALKQFLPRRATPNLISKYRARELALHYGALSPPFTDTNSPSHETSKEPSSSSQPPAISQHHPNIIQALAIIPTPTSLYLALEYIPTTLASWIDSLQTPLRTAELKFLFRQLHAGVSYVHARGIMHRDLNPSNIFIITTTTGPYATSPPTPIAKIADFGEARPFRVPGPGPGRCRRRTSDADPREGYTIQVGTLWYRAPEIALGSGAYGPSIDLWSLGCVLAEMILLEPLFQGDSDLEILGLITAVLGMPSESEARWLEGVAGSGDLVAWMEMRVSGQGGEGTLGVKLRAVEDEEVRGWVLGLLRWRAEERGVVVSEGRGKGFGFGDYEVGETWNESAAMRILMQLEREGGSRSRQD